MAAAGELAGSSGRSLTSGYGVSLQGRSAGRVVADDVDWEAIARQMGSRNHTQCMDKWCAGGRGGGCGGAITRTACAGGAHG